MLGVLDVCGSGYGTYVLNGNNVGCNPNVPTCPIPYTCRLSTGTNQYYCCKTVTQPGKRMDNQIQLSLSFTLTYCPVETPIISAINVCAAFNQRPYVINGNPVVCSTGSSATNCPPPYLCRLYTPTNTFYCCQSAVTTTIRPPTNRNFPDT